MEYATPSGEADEAAAIEAVREKTRNDLDAAIAAFAREKNEHQRDYARWGVVKAAVEYALRNNASYLDPARPMHFRECEFRLRDDGRLRD